ncbi:hypothetical protein J6590_106176, partial [Homalodisca vitripennis]
NTSLYNVGLYPKLNNLVVAIITLMSTPAACPSPHKNSSLYNVGLYPKLHNLVVAIITLMSTPTACLVVSQLHNLVVAIITLISTPTACPSPHKNSSLYNVDHNYSHVNSNCLPLPLQEQLTIQCRVVSQLHNLVVAIITLMSTPTACPSLHKNSSLYNVGLYPKLHNLVVAYSHVNSNCLQLPPPPTEHLTIQCRVVSQLHNLLVAIITLMSTPTACPSPSTRTAHYTM